MKRLLNLKHSTVTHSLQNIAGDMVAERRSLERLRGICRGTPVESESFLASRCLKACMYASDPVSDPAPAYRFTGLKRPGQIELSDSIHI